MEDFAYVDKNVYINILLTILNKCKEYLLGIGILKLTLCLCIILISIIFAKRKNKKKKKISIYIQLNNVRKNNNKDEKLIDNEKCSFPNEEAKITEPDFSKLCEHTDGEKGNNEFYYISYSPHIFDLKSISRTELCNVCNESIYSFIFYKKDIFECVVCRNKCHIECAPNSNLMSCKTSVFFKNKHKFIKIRNCLWNNKCDICNKKFSYFSFPPFVKQYIYNCIWCNKYFHVHCIAKISDKRKNTRGKNQVKDALCTYGNRKYILYPYEVSIKENILIDFLTHAYHLVKESEITNDEVLLSYSCNKFNVTIKDDGEDEDTSNHCEKKPNEGVMKEKEKEKGGHCSTTLKNTDEVLYLDYVNDFHKFNKIRKFKNANKTKKHVIPVHANFLLNFFPIHLPIYEIKSSDKFLLIFVNVKSGGQAGKKLYQQLLMYFNPLQIISIKNEKNVLSALNMYKEMLYLNKVILLLCGGDGTISIFVDTLLKFFSKQVSFAIEQGKMKKKNNKLCSNENKSEQYYSYTKSTFLNKTIMNITAKLKHNKDAFRKKWTNNITSQSKKPITFFLKKRSEKNTFNTDNDSGHISEENAETYFENDLCEAHMWGENNSENSKLKMSRRFTGSRRIDDPTTLCASGKCVFSGVLGQLPDEIHHKDKSHAGRTYNGIYHLDGNTDMNANINSRINSDENNLSGGGNMHNEMSSEMNSSGPGGTVPNDPDKRGTEAKCTNGKYLYMHEKFKNFNKKKNGKHDTNDEKGEKIYANSEHVGEKGTYIENGGEIGTYIGNDREKGTNIGNGGEDCVKGGGDDKDGWKESTLKSFQNGNSMIEKYYNSNTMIHSNYTENNEYLYSSSKGTENDKMYYNILYHDYKEKVTSCSSMKTKINENFTSYFNDANMTNQAYETNGTTGEENTYTIDNKQYNNVFNSNCSNNNSLVNDGSCNSDCRPPLCICNGEHLAHLEKVEQENLKGKGNRRNEEHLNLGQLDSYKSDENNIIYKIDNYYKIAYPKEKRNEKNYHNICEENDIINNVITGEDKEMYNLKPTLQSYISNTPISILPLGTGNDLSYSLGWGCGYNNDPLVYLNKVKDCKNEYVDVWNMKAYDLDNNLILNNSFINYFDIGIISRLALHFDNIRKKFPHFFNSRIGNKILYGEVGFRDFCFNTYKYKLNKNIKLYCDGKKVKIDEDLESVCLINVPYFLGGLKIWKEDEQEKNYYSDVDRQKEEYKKKKRNKKGRKSLVEENKATNSSSNSSFLCHSTRDKVVHNEKNHDGTISNNINDKTTFYNSEKVTEEFLIHDTSKHSAEGEKVDLDPHSENSKNGNTSSQKHPEEGEESSIEEKKKPSVHTNDNMFDCSNIYKSYRLDFYRQKKNKQKYRKQKMDDKVIEVIGFRNMFHLLQVQIGMSKAIKLCQGSEIKVKIDKTFIQNKNKIYFQYDGEPGFLNIHKLHFTHKCQCLFLSPKDPI
ncbi:diacylglycerol kinase [Plasmodium gonderi]|uniref:diacylglycerol kinase (ATP) n=1 Tax=Plasmodium gonderi TaxID=77519 RepID=A0A1Y1JCY4_PLAGO|nr:diacylglycerol kinase [Plasmodium gonderi]GAW80369.1 diacylglycerol kinase [Plasmodium gonderi]